MELQLSTPEDTRSGGGAGAGAGAGWLRGGPALGHLARSDPPPLSFPLRIPYRTNERILGTQRPPPLSFPLRIPYRTNERIPGTQQPPPPIVPPTHPISYQREDTWHAARRDRTSGASVNDAAWPRARAVGQRGGARGARRGAGRGHSYEAGERDVSE